MVNSRESVLRVAHRLVHSRPSGANGFRHRMNTLDSTREQLAAVNAFFEAQKALSDHLVYVDDEEENGGESDDHNQLAA